MQQFGIKLREMRKKKGLSQKDLALAANISPSYLSRIERGERGIPHPSCLAGLAKRLEVSVGDLLRLAGYEYEETDRLPLHWHSIVADPALDETIKELGSLTEQELIGLQLYLQAIKLHRIKEEK